jgi:hypothetical protein
VTVETDTSNKQPRNKFGGDGFALLFGGKKKERGEEEIIKMCFNFVFKTLFLVMEAFFSETARTIPA